MHAPYRYRTIECMKDFSWVLREVSESFDRSGISGGILTGLSGGADSVALLRTLAVLRGEKGFPLSAVYVNHGLRESARDEETFCANLCASLDVPFYIRRVHVKASGNTEAEARKERYAAFDAVMKETGSGVLALAHHQDDQAETVLLHLLYGAGLSGLGGMQEYRPPVWRPFLRVRREQLRAALRELGQDWREDESNADDAYARNYLRATLFPLLNARFPEAVSAIGRAAEILQGENEYLNIRAEEWIGKNASKGKHRFLMLDPFTDLHPAIQRHILRAYLEKSEIALEFDQTERIRALLQASAGSACNLPCGWRALRTKTRVHFLPPQHPDAQAELGGISDSPFSGDVGDGILRQAVPADLLEKACLRTRLPGDWIAPLGLNGSMKLKDYMISRDIDRPFRDSWPLLCAGNEVLWVIGAGVSERLRVKPGDDPRQYRIAVYSGNLPDAL